MKKKYLALLFALLMSSISVEAAEVTPAKAAAVAKQIMAEKVEGFADEVKEVKAVGFEGQKSYYVVQFAKGGWALISADDMSSPLLGYSGEGTFVTDGQPENMKYMLDIYSRQIRDHRRLNGSRHAGWTAASRPTGNAARKAPRHAATKVEPLIKVNWNQTGPYANFVREWTKDDKVPVGCVAVGMAQAMSVHRYPDRPQGYHAYTSANYGSLYVDYDKASAYDWDGIMTGAAGKLHIARLLWHCGVSVDMNYAPGGSGASEGAIPNALKSYFKYPDVVKVHYRDSYQGNWKQLIIDEITSGRAVIYCGADPVKSYGHCFNLDGYDGEFFNVNWGWGGANNGYFSLDALRDATMDMNYTSGQSAVVDVRPPSEKPSNLFLSNKSVEYNQPAGTVVGDVTVESEATNPTYTYKVMGEYNVVFHRTMPAPFEVVDGQLVTTEVLSEEDYGSEINITITVTNNQNKATLTRNFTIKLGDASGITDVKEANMITGKSYYTAAGAQLNEMQPGINIVRKRMADGSISTVKIIK